MVLKVDIIDFESVNSYINHDIFKYFVGERIDFEPINLLDPVDFGAES